MIYMMKTDRKQSNMSRNTMESFKQSIASIRNILRRIAICDMNSVRTSSLYFIARSIREKAAAELGIPSDLLWESLYDLCQKGEADKSLERFKTKLLPILDAKFTLYKFSFDVSDTDAHREIMNIVNELNLQEHGKVQDILGTLYEYHLESGSANSRDLGQFFTDRLVCKYMINLVKPTLKRTGVPESVCDPTMGTAGFLTTYVNHFEGTPIDWSIQQQNVHGCDHEERLVGLASINLFLETGSHFRNMKKRDSLADGLPLSKYDIILANPPFGLENINSKKCHSSIQELDLPGLHSETVFLQLMMAHLAPGGRCAAIFPNGLFENQYADHKATRQYLLDKFEVQKIIKFNSSKPKGPKRGSVKNAKFFIGTGVQCSILVFANTGRPTTQIEWYELERSETGLKESFIKTVRRDQINNAVSLDISKYMDIDVDPSHPTLATFCRHENGRTLKGGNPNAGEYPIMGGGTDYNGRNTEYNREPGTISVSKSGTAGYVHWHTRRFWAGDCFTIHTNDPAKLNEKYLYYYLSTHPEAIKSRRTGSTVPHCKWEDIANMPIKVPPIDVQMAIVAKLDALYEQKKKAQEFLESVDSLARTQLESEL